MTISLVIRKVRSMKLIPVPNSHDVVNELALQHCGNGDLIKRKPNAKTVWVINHYDRSSKMYSLSDYNDYNREIFLKPSTLVYVGFEF